MSIKIHKQTSFNDLFINDDYIGFAGSCYSIYDPTFQYECNFLTTEITLINRFLDKYKGLIIDNHFYNECFLRDTAYLDIKQELEQIEEISKRCFKIDKSNVLKYRVSSRGFRIEFISKKQYFAFFRRNEYPMHQPQNKEILFENQQGIPRFQKDYNFATDDNVIFNELFEYIKNNEK